MMAMFLISINFLSFELLAVNLSAQLITHSLAAFGGAKVSQIRRASEREGRLYKNFLIGYQANSHRLAAISFFLQKPANDIHNDCDQYAKYDHGDKWKIESEVFSFYPDIAWQPSNPVQFIVKEVNDDAYDDYQDSKNDNIFTCSLVHSSRFIVKVQS
jgi:hypothetical protein